jgi:hypothetical protein
MGDHHTLTKEHAVWDWETSCDSNSPQRP